MRAALMMMCDLGVRGLMVCDDAAESDRTRQCPAGLWGWAKHSWDAGVWCVNAYVVCVCICVSLVCSSECLI